MFLLVTPMKRSLMEVLVVQQVEWARHLVTPKATAERTSSGVGGSWNNPGDSYAPPGCEGGPAHPESNHGSPVY